MRVAGKLTSSAIAHAASVDLDGGGVSTAALVELDAPALAYGTSL
jgi:hypothetical protein